MEEIRGDDENFPVGLRVLAVDDDPTCLKLLETLLRKCLYTVTTTNQARIALNMIREDKDRFDLVISDVYMPDMDGFKLLELVGLEMDLPVIMLSANSDPKLVMKGITHGACDYLVKPVRIEELKNVWQHVIRRKKFDSTNQNRSSDKGKAPLESGEDPGPLLEGNTDHNVSNRKRKDDDDDDSEDYGNECDEPGAQKRPRVVWSLELHRKFVAAVNHLGIEKAVPKRILDIMNDEGLTRENVASHLQKYRLYLKRISGAANQQGNAGAALGVKDALFMPVGRMSNVALSPYTNGGMLGRLTGPGNVNLRNLTPTTLVQPSRAQNLSRSTNPSTLVQPGRDQNLSSSTNLLRQMHPVLPNSSQNPGLFQETQSSLKLDQLQQNAVAANFNAINNSRMLRTASTFSDTGAVLGSSNNLLNSSMRNPLMLHGNAQQPLTGGGFRGQSAHGIALTSESFNTGVYGSSNLLDPGKFNENWQNTVETSEMHPNPLLAAQPFYSSNGPYEQINSVGLPSPMALPAFGDSRAMQCQVGSMADLQNMSQVPGQSWLEQRQNYGNSSQFPGDGITRNLGQSSGFMNQNMDNFENSSASMQQNDDSVEELLNSMFTREHDETMGNGEFGFDDYSFGAHPC